MDLTEAEDIKKRWQEYTEELYKKKKKIFNIYNRFPKRQALYTHGLILLINL